MAIGCAMAAYSVVFVVVECSTSPTDEQTTLDDGRVVSFMRWGATHGPIRAVLVHGAPADASSWTRLRATAGDSGAIEWIAIDRPGYGNSAPGTETSLAEQAAAIGPFLDDPPAGGVVLVGHSFGGPVVLRAAAQFPDRVRKIVLVAGACDAYMNDAEWFRKGVNSLSGVVPAPWAAANRELLALTEENREMETMLDRVTCEVTVVHGTWDPVCPYEGTVNYLKSRLINAASVDIVTLMHAGHNIQLSHPELIIDQVVGNAGVAASHKN